MGKFTKTGGHFGVPLPENRWFLGPGSGSGGHFHENQVPWFWSKSTCLVLLQGVNPDSEHGQILCQISDFGVFGGSKNGWYFWSKYLI